MRMIPTHYTGKAQPSLAKKTRAQVAHIGPPLSGLSMATRFTQGDPQTATILRNFTVEDDRIQTRAGYIKKSTRGTAPVWCLIPYYSTVSRIAAASNGEIWDADTGSLLKGGFTSNDWHWTAFANLGQQDFTVLVNGADGVWSWDGGSVADGVPVTITAISKANPAVVTVSGSLVGFTNGGNASISGITGTFAICNGNHVIANVGSPAGTFTMGVDTTAVTGSLTGPATAVPTGSFVKETVTAPSGNSWINPDNFNITLVHMNRLWFADKTSLAVYYLPLQSKSGEVKYLPLNALFRRGGSIRAMYTWTMDGGAGLNDQLVIFSSNGECVIYQGTDPDDAVGGNWQLSGIYRFDSPMSKHAIANYGGELYVLISTGLVPMSTLLRAETENLGQTDRNIISIFLKEAISFRTTAGWQTFVNPSSGRLFCNMPMGSKNKYKQLIRHMPRAIWSEYDGVPARCWGWVDPYVYFADDDGNVYQHHPAYTNDNGKPINVDVQMAWSQFKTPARKHFLILQTYIVSDGSPQPVIDMKVDYDYTPGVNIPDITSQTLGTPWDSGTWDIDAWAPGEHAITIWNGVSPLGRVAAPRLTAQVYNCTFSVTGWDVVFEAGTFT